MGGEMQINKSLRRMALAGGVLALAAVSASAAGWGPQGLTGIWKCGAGDPYYVQRYGDNYLIRQQADQVFWYGENSGPQPGSAWRNVAHGFIDQRTGMITLTWADVQNRYSPLNGGLLVLKYDDSAFNWNQIKVTESTNVFPVGWSCYQ
jgi:hypothetical protein